MFRLFVIIFYLLVSSEKLMAASAQRIQLGSSSFIFAEEEKLQAFKQRYQSHACFSDNPPAGCQCKFVEMQAQIEALKNGAPLENNKKLKKFVDKFDHFSTYAHKQATRRVASEACLPFGSYDDRACSQTRNINRRKSCACLEKWTKQNINYLAKKINQIISSQDFYPGEDLNLSLGIMASCQGELSPEPIMSCQTASPINNSKPRSRKRRTKSTRTRSISVTPSAQDLAVNEDAQLIKDLSLQELLCTNTDLEKKNALVRYLSQNEENPIYDQSTLKRELSVLGDLRYCLLPINKMKIARRKIPNFSATYKDSATFQFACLFSGATMSTYCLNNSQLQQNFDDRIRLNCSSSAAGNIQHPPYGVGSRSPYAINGRSGIHLKSTTACRAFMDKCHQHSKQVQYQASTKSALHHQITNQFLTPFANENIEGKSLASACAGSEPTYLTKQIEDLEERFLDADIKGSVTSAATSAIGFAVKRFPVLDKIYDNGGETIVGFIISSAIELKYQIDSIEISKTDQQGRARSAQTIQKLYKKEMERKIQKAIQNIEDEMISSICKPDSEYTSMIQFFDQTQDSLNVMTKRCQQLIKKYNIGQKIASLF